jgi:hypothetical protein
MLGGSCGSKQWIEVKAVVIAMTTSSSSSSSSCAGALNQELLDLLHSVVQSLGSLVDRHHALLSQLQLHLALEQLQVG